MAKPGYTGFTRIIKAAGYSLRGFRAAWKHESAFRQETLLAAILIPFAIWLGQNATQIALLVGTLFLVVIVELLNSAIEAVVDRVSDEHHKLSGRAKDMGSAAVFVALALTAVVWTGIAVERFFPAFRLH
jgi:diacylglycerol kinase (ATP)